jgi:hypothetical protein
MPLGDRMGWDFILPLGFCTLAKFQNHSHTHNDIFHLVGRRVSFCIPSLLQCTYLPLGFRCSFTKPPLAQPSSYDGASLFILLSLKRVGSTPAQGTDFCLQRNIYLTEARGKDIFPPLPLPIPTTQFSILYSKMPLWPTNTFCRTWFPGSSGLPNCPGFPFTALCALFVVTSWSEAHSRKLPPSVSVSQLPGWWRQSAGTLPSGHTLANEATPPHWGSWKQNQIEFHKAAVWFLHFSKICGNGLVYHSEETYVPFRYGKHSGHNMMVRGTRVYHKV